MRAAFTCGLGFRFERPFSSAQWTITGGGSRSFLSFVVGPLGLRCIHSISAAAATAAGRRLFTPACRHQIAACRETPAAWGGFFCFCGKPPHSRLFNAQCSEISCLARPTTRQPAATVANGWRPGLQWLNWEKKKKDPALSSNRFGSSARGEGPTHRRAISSRCGPICLLSAKNIPWAGV